MFGGGPVPFSLLFAFPEGGFGLGGLSFLRGGG
jgi:hypothetical protein